MLMPKKVKHRKQQKGRMKGKASRGSKLNFGDFGLQAGIVTNEWGVIKEAFDDIEVGGLMVNDASTFRVDHMPYGGVKDSGTGREGLRYAIEEMSELKLLMINNRS